MSLSQNECSGRSWVIYISVWSSQWHDESFKRDSFLFIVHSCQYFNVESVFQGSYGHEKPGKVMEF